jgi:hypothetical protein
MTLLESERKLITNYALEHVGIPYKNEPPYSLDEGFNCFYWADHLYKLIGIDIEHDMKITKALVSKFTKVEEPQVLDIPVFYINLLSTRHIGVMLDEFRMSHCSKGTNGVAVSDITRQPWKMMLKGIYRLK